MKAWKTMNGRTRRWLLGAVALGGLLGLVVLAVAWEHREGLLAWLDGLRLALVAWLQVVPLGVYAVLFVVLPALGAPLTLFYLTVGAMVEGLWGSLFLAWGCVLGNMILAYFLGHTLLRRVIARVVERRGLRVPQILPELEWKVILMLRTSPLPWVFQNYLLALGGARLGPYLVLSMLIQGAIGAGVIAVGESLLSGQGKYALLGVFVFFAVSIGLSVLRRKTAQADKAGDLGEVGV